MVIGGYIELNKYEYYKYEAIDLWLSPDFHLDCSLVSR